MTGPEFERLQKLFEHAAGLDEKAREAFLKQISDDGLRTELAEMLRQHFASGDFLQPPTPGELQGLGFPGSEDKPWTLGDYRLLRRLGRGGMGEVWLAEHAGLKRQVAVKLLPPHPLLSPRHLERFAREAQAAARLRNPNIVGIHDVGEDHGIHFFVMEYIEGCSLRDVLKVRLDRREDPEATGPGPAAEFAEMDDATYRTRIVELIAVVADALQYAHDQSVWHRDIKPENILVDKTAAPRLVDFGLAKDPDLESITAVGELTGTHYYMSPEQAMAKRVQLDHRTDIFSLGVILYEALTLQRPFEGDSAQEVLAAIMYRHPCPARQLNRFVSTDLQTVGLKALEKNPELRYENAAEFAADLRAAGAGKAIVARPPAPWVRASRWFSRFPRTTRVATATAATVLIAVSTIVAWSPLSTYYDRPLLTLSAFDGQGQEIDGAEVLLQPLTDYARIEEPEIMIGETPIHGARVKPGRYRITVATGSGFAELTRTLEEADREYSERLVIRTTEVVLRPAGDPDANMIRIESKDAPISWDGPGGMPMTETVVRIAEFWMDRYEVSNGEYRAFLEDRDYWRILGLDPLPPPPVWTGTTSVDRDPPVRWEDLPVVGVSYYDARAFAEWKGKRLPTTMEWQRAARGTEGRLRPWGNDRDPTRAIYDRKDKIPLPDPSETSKEAYYDILNRNYLWVVMPVRSMPEGIGPEGLHHSMGNVDEWTEGMPVRQPEGGTWKTHRIVMGYPWRRYTPSIVRLDVLPSEPARLREHNLIGFRCAKSTRGGETRAP